MRYFYRTTAPECAREIVDDGTFMEEGDGESPSWLRFSRRKNRRAATAMEYLFMISLILCAAITGIGYFGQSTKNNMQNTSNAIQKATSAK